MMLRVTIETGSAGIRFASRVFARGRFGRPRPDRAPPNDRTSSRRHRPAHKSNGPTALNPRGSEDYREHRPSFLTQGGATGFDPGITVALNAARECEDCDLATERAE